MVREKDHELSQRNVRIVATVLMLALLSPIAVAFVSEIAGGSQGKIPAKRIEGVSGPDRTGYTVITTQEFNPSYPEAELIVLASNGTTEYVNDKWDTYFDVDPVVGHEQTVEYVAAEYLSTDQCAGSEPCTREVFVRENITTGRSRVLWSRISPGKESTRIHDIDRLDDDRVLIADIYTDSVFIYNTTSELRTWTWNAQRDFPIQSGGPFPSDWTHLNDVELLPDGKIMVSLRNQDSVVFLAPNGTLLSNQTLGEDDRHSILYEQHNPDYLSGARPTVLVADSENDRILEYARTNGNWTVSWRWSDPELSWPRDADRLPNGHTLIADTNGNRVLEIDRSGDVVWTAEVGLPYDVERLSTGDESTDGPTAQQAELVSRGPSLDEQRQTKDRNAGVRDFLQTLVPTKVRHGIGFIMPSWAKWWHSILLACAFFVSACWGVLEYRWAELTVQSPITRD